MQFTLKIIPIETKPRVGYFVYHNDDFQLITAINVKEQTCDLSNGETTDLVSVSKQVAKIVGEVVYDKGEKTIVQTYSIIHSDYIRIFESLKREVEYAEETPMEERKYKTFKDALMDNYPIKYDGVFESIMSRTVVDEVVSISSIKIIDRYELYKKEDRIGIVTKYDRDHRTFHVKLSNSGRVITCQREDFVKIHDDNIIQMIHVKCPYCGR